MLGVTSGSHVYFQTVYARINYKSNHLFNIFNCENACSRVAGTRVRCSKRRLAVMAKVLKRVHAILQQVWSLPNFVLRRRQQNAALQNVLKKTAASNADEADGIQQEVNSEIWG